MSLLHYAFIIVAVIGLVNLIVGFVKEYKNN
jgi:hypothetical protein